MSTATVPPPTPRLKERYQSELRAKLCEEFTYSNVHLIPNMKKVVVSMGLGEAVRDSKVIVPATEQLAKITGRRPCVTKARKSIAQFKLRERTPIGVHVTLRGNTMWEFIDRLINLALPRIRDFRGLGDQLDGCGNYSLGLSEQSVFHEIDPDAIDKTRGLNITIVTTAKTDPEGRALLKHLGFPFKSQ